MSQLRVVLAGVVGGVVAVRLARTLHPLVWAVERSYVPPTCPWRQA